MIAQYTEYMGSEGYELIGAAFEVHGELGLLEKKYYPDLLISKEIIAEIKSVKVLNSEHERQLLNYMRITRKAVGYLVNFGPLDKLEWKRFILKEYIHQ